MTAASNDRPTSVTTDGSVAVDDAVAAVPQELAEVASAEFADRLRHTCCSNCSIEMVTMMMYAQGTSALVLVEGAVDEIDDLPPVNARILEMARLGSWSNEDEATDDRVGLAGIASSDLDAWLEQGLVQVDNRRTVIVDGTVAEVFDAVVNPTAPSVPGLCEPGAEPCLWYGSVEGASTSGTPETDRSQRPHELLIQGQTISRIWVIPIRGFDPLVVRAAAPVGDVKWLETVEAGTIATLDLSRDAG